MIKYLINVINVFFKRLSILLYRRRRSKYKYLSTLKEIINSYTNRTELYLYCHHYFWNFSEKWLRDHREYFSKERRGFGEDAFHIMWYFIFKTYKPVNILEIGVYRGQTLTLFELLSLKFSVKSSIHGISPFNSSGDEVSAYSSSFDYYQDVKNNFDYFELKYPFLHKGFSTDDIIVETIKSKKWDLIYIDGNHDYEIVKSDFTTCSDALNVNGLIILDDSALYTDYKPPIFATAGHPGPSKLSHEINLSCFKEIFSVGHNRVFQKINN
jgi:hypothetical protein